MSEIERRILAPKEGGRVRRPDTKLPLAAEGESVVMDRYWRRRLLHGDVVEVTPAGDDKAAKKGAAA